MRTFLVALACFLGVVVLFSGFKWLGSDVGGTKIRNSGKPSSAAEVVREERTESARPVEAAKNSDLNPQHPPGINAADLYKDAYSLYQSLSHEEQEKLKKPLQQAPENAALFEKIGPILELLRRAKSEASYVDWGTGKFRYDSPVPQISVAMDLSRLAGWAARYQFPSDPKLAMECVTMQRLIGLSVADQAMIGNMVSQVAENLAINAISENVNSLTPETLSIAVGMFSPTDFQPLLVESMAKEKYTANSILEDLRNPAKRETTIQLVVGMMDEQSRNSITDINEAIAVFDRKQSWLDRVYDEFPANATRGPAEFEAWLGNVRPVGDHSALLSNSVFSLEQMQRGLLKVQVRQAMLHAGLSALQNQTPGFIPSDIDPSTGTRFRYVPTQNGFELHSTYSDKYKPVSMSFQRPAPSR